MLMSVNGRLTRPPRATETKAKKKESEERENYAGKSNGNEGIIA